jgi:hypothetical protein
MIAGNGRTLGVIVEPDGPKAVHDKESGDLAVLRWHICAARMVANELKREWGIDDVPGPSPGGWRRRSVLGGVPPTGEPWITSICLDGTAEVFGWRVCVAFSPAGTYTTSA